MTETEMKRQKVGSTGARVWFWSIVLAPWPQTSSHLSGPHLLTKGPLPGVGQGGADSGPCLPTFIKCLWGGLVRGNALDTHGPPKQ